MDVYGAMNTFIYPPIFTPFHSLPLISCLPPNAMEMAFKRNFIQQQQNQQQQQHELQQQSSSISSSPPPNTSSSSLSNASNETSNSSSSSTSSLHTESQQSSRSASPLQTTVCSSDFSSFNIKTTNNYAQCQMLNSTFINPMNNFNMATYFIPPPPMPQPTTAFAAATFPSVATLPAAPVSFGALNCMIFIPSRKRQLYGMEETWLNEFSKIFQIFPHQWKLIFIEKKPIGGNLVYTYNDSAKVRFACSICGHGWTSMKGRVTFFFDYIIPGLILYTLYGQQCQKCESQEYQDAMWYPEEVTKVLINVRDEVGQLFYALSAKPKEKMRRSGKPKTPHNMNLCQACQNGICSFKI